jgi:hypothetical protein
MYQTFFSEYPFNVLQNQRVVLVHHMSIDIQVYRINTWISVPEVGAQLRLARGYSSSEPDPVKLLSLIVHNSNNYINNDRLKLTMDDEALLLKKDRQGWQ